MENELDVKVTVVIMTYNREKFIQRAINSVVNQILKNWKLLIMDDCSTDNTKDIIEPFLKQDNRITYYRLPKNVGICRVLNQALKLVDTKYMVQLDSDDWLEEIALEKLLNAMEKEKDDVALAYGNHKVWKSEEKGKIKKQRSFTTEEKYELLCHPEVYYPRFYRTQCLRDVGGWNENDKYNGRYMEDRRIQFKLIEHYHFLGVDEHLYNLNRYIKKRQTSSENRHKYIELKKELIVYYLQKWGEEYTPEFSIQEARWLRTTLIPKEKETSKTRNT
mgnify:CR=1 FL=1